VGAGITVISGGSITDGAAVGWRPQSQRHHLTGGAIKR